MICRKCGSEVASPVKFCPNCGAMMVQPGVKDETMALPSLPDDLLDTPIDLAAFDAAAKDFAPRTPTPPAEPTRIMPAAPRESAPRRYAEPTDDYAAPQAYVPRHGQSEPQGEDYAPRPRPRRAAEATRHPRAPRYEDEQPTPRRKSRAPLIVALILLLGIGIGGFLFWRNAQDDGFRRAERFMQRADFTSALAAYEGVLDTAYASDNAKNTATAQIGLLKDYFEAQKLLEAGEFEEATVLFNRLLTRITDKQSPLYTAVQDHITQADDEKATAQFDADLAAAQQYFDEEQYDRAAAILDTLEADTKLTDAQKTKVKKLRDEVTEKQKSLVREQQNDEQREDKKQDFSQRITTQEEMDLLITNAPTTEESYNLTASSFEAWDMLLAEMYDHLSSILPAEQWDAEQQDYKSWINSRDTEAAKAAEKATKQAEQQDTDEEDAKKAAKLAGDLAEKSYKQSVTKLRCRKLLDMM